jgi:predicted outer membrane repeat protein
LDHVHPAIPLMRVFLLLLISVLSCRAATFTVTNSNNSGAGSLRQAITDANVTAAADTIVFNTAGHFSVARTITLTSQLIVSNPVTINAPAAANQRVTLSGGGSTRVMRDVMQVAGAITLRNLTLRDGVSAGDGGGISVEGVQTDLQLENCLITACTATGSGGGLYAVRDADVIMTATTLSLNTASEGGGLYNWQGSVTMTGGMLTGNVTTGPPSLNGNGAGIQVESGGLTMTGVQASLNVASSRGGAVYGGSGLIVDCLFSGNRSTTGGGAIYLSGDNTTFRNCTFSANQTTDGSGGALAIIDPGYAPVDVELHHCTFQANSAGSGEGFGEGGAIGCRGLRAVLKAMNCTLSGNTAAEGGGVSGSGNVELRNCTITGNDAERSGGGILASGIGTFAIGNCLVAGNTAGDRGPDYATSPGFASDGSEVRGSFTTLGHNLVGIRTAALSDLLDGVSGDRLGTAAAPLDPRLGPLASNGGTTQTHALLAGSPAVDAGDSALITDPPFTGPAFTDQQGRPRVEGSAVDIGAVEQAVLEVGTLADSGVGSLRDIIAQANLAGGGTIGLKRSVFAGARQTITLTSGQIPVTTAITITAPEVGVTLSGNNNSRIFNITGGADLRLERFHLTDGKSTAEGGAIRVNGAATKLVLKSSSISGCDAVGGGGLLVENGTAQVTDCFFKSNTAGTGGGGAIKVTANGTLRLTNSTVTLNTSNTNGGGFFQDTGTTTLINTTFAANTADADTNNTGNGGGLFQSGGTVSLGNSIVASNLDLSSGTLHPDYSGTFSTLGHNLIGITQGGAGLVNGANGDLSGNTGAPLNPRLTAGGGTTWYVPQVTSPAVNAGDNALLDRNAWPSAPARDQRGQYRVVNSTVDIGAVEGPLEAVVTLDVAEAAGSERGPVPAKLRLTRSLATGSLPVTFTVDSVSTASAADYTLSGPSYTAGPHTVVFADGEERILLRVTPVNDALPEGTEAVVVSLTGAGYALDSGSPGTQSVSLLDDEFLITSNASSGPGSLREAIKQCNDFGGGKITLTPGLGITLRGSALPIDGDVEIIGNVSTISAAGRSRVFEITGDGGSTVKLQGLILAGGMSTSDGGGLFIDQARVELRGCALTLNQAGHDGGAVFARGHSLLTVVNSSIHDNTARSGGGIAAETDLVLTNTTLARNESKTGGGGLFFSGSATATLTNCTFAENRAGTDPAAALDQGGGALYCPQGTVLFRNTVISGNTDAAGTGVNYHNLRVAGGTFQTGGGNFFADNHGVSGLSPGSPNANADYVGSTTAPLNPRLIAQPDLRPFYAFPPASLLSGRGVNSHNTEPNDQRGRPRITGSTIDIGAVEMSAIPVTSGGDSGMGTLRQAIADANAAGGGDILLDEIFFDGTRNIGLATGELTVTSPVDIMAPAWPAADQVQISTFAPGRVMKLVPSASAAITLRQLKLYGGDTTANTAGDRNGGLLLAGANAAVQLLKCTLVNGTSPADGGLIMVTANASVTVRDSELLSGTANRGGLIASSGVLTLDRCTLRSGISSLNGGGLFNSGTAALLNCSFFNNAAAGSGGAIFHAGGTSTLTLTHCTLHSNRSNYNNNNSSGNGGGIRQLSGPISLRNTLLTQNFEGNGPSAIRADLAGTFNSAGYNRIASTGTSTGMANGVNGDQTGTTAAPLSEEPLQVSNNGGPTLTSMLRSGSPCIDAGDDTGAPLTDQRGLLRRYGNGVDIGACELQPEPYLFWADHVFPPASANTGPAADFDQDGVLNEIEYATGSNPRSPTSLPVITATLDGAQCHFDHTRSILSLPGILQLRLSVNLSTWNDGPSPVLLGTDPLNGVETWRTTVNGTAFPRRFARLEKVP